MDLENHPLFLPDDAVERCLKTFGVTPKPLQLEVAKKIGQGVDCVLIPGFGRGEPLTYFLPLLFWPGRTIIVLTSLTALGHEQQRKFAAANISSIFIMHEAIIDSACIGDLASGKYQAVFMSPELVFNCTRLIELWVNSDWGRQVLAVIIDEAHCINHRGNDFREAYGRIGEIRRWLPPVKAFIAVTATLTNSALEAISECLSYKDNVSVIKEGNDRTNVNRDECENAHSYLRSLAPECHCEQIGIYHSAKLEERKERVMRRFRNNSYLILLATEAAGIGCDISDVVRVVQYGMPSSLSTLVQRIGRAARDSKLQGEGILLHAKTLSRHTRPETEDDLHLRQYVTTNQCRRAIINRIFNNKQAQVDECCDRCHPNLVVLVEMSGTKRINLLAKENERVKEAIEQWRKDMHETVYHPLRSFIGVKNVMPDKIIDRIVKKFGSIDSGDTLQKVATWNANEAETQSLWDILHQLQSDILSNRMQDAAAEDLGVAQPEHNTFNSPLLMSARVPAQWQQQIEELEYPQKPTRNRVQKHPQTPTRVPVQRRQQLMGLTQTPTRDRQQKPARNRLQASIRVRFMPPFVSTPNRRQPRTNPLDSNEIQ
ncbi:P-loop containing nucleoside triphosphate hydrolase protein [Dissophora ornata]|nr:P-loop containing nucleoside triphosphate hydrolase protein [Dissophora ornata]